MTANQQVLIGAGAVAAFLWWRQRTAASSGAGAGVSSGAAAPRGGAGIPGAGGIANWGNYERPAGWVDPDPYDSNDLGGDVWGGVFDPLFQPPRRAPVIRIVT